MIRRRAFLFCTCILLAAFAATPAFASTTSGMYYKRGIFTQWSRDFVTWTWSHGNVTQSGLTQECGAVFPNTIYSKSKSLYKYSSSHWRYTSTYHAGAGANTQWGPINVWSYDSSDYLHVYGDGSRDASHS